MIKKILSIIGAVKLTLCIAVGISIGLPASFMVTGGGALLVSKISNLLSHKGHVKLGQKINHGEEMLKNSIEKVWNKESENVNCINEAIELLDSGKLRIAEKIDGKWVVNDYLKKAILLFFRFNKSEIMEGGSCPFFDKVPLKTENWREEDFVRAGFRSVPGSLIRKGAHIEKSVVLMPCFINIGAYIGESTMIDSNALVGSCAQIGKNCHISDGVTIGGVLEPLQANPVIIEDNCFIGARSVITEGVIVGEGSVIGAGVVLSASTKIIDRETGAVSFGYIPPYSVVVAGTYSTDNGLSLCCAVVVKKVTAETRKKTAINELLRQ